jgi:hypothetical protein
MTILRSVLVLTLVAVCVAGCGGGSSSPPPTAPGPLGVNEHEPNDFAAQAVGTLSTRDIHVTGTTSNATDVDLYQVTAAGPVTLYASLDWSSGSDLELTISNADGIFVREVDTLGHPETCRLAGLPAGTYSIRVGSFTSASTAYTLTLGQR